MAEQECVGFIDMDCFYVAVERTLDKSLVGVPCAVCQYESQQKNTKTVDRTENRKVTVGGASLIAVSYEARARGVTRMMNTGTARKQCSAVHNQISRRLPIITSAPSTRLISA